MTRVSRLIVLAGSLVFFCGTVAPAEAAFVLHICDVAGCSGVDLAIADESVTDITAGTVGRISAFAAGVGGFGMFDIETSLSKPEIGSSETPAMQITFQATSTGAAEAWIYAVDTGFTGVGPLTMDMGGTTSRPTRVTVDGKLFGGTSDSGLDLTTTLGSLGPYSASSFSGSTISSPVTGSVSPYSLSLLVHIRHTGAAVTTGSLLASAVSVPEPPTYLLFTVALGTLLLALFALQSLGIMPKPSRTKALEPLVR
jgi:hypothetical protein